MIANFDETEQLFLQHQHEIRDDLVRMLRDEIEMQGHRATGSLIDSVEGVVDATIDGFSTDILHNKYGIFQDKGVRAKNIPFSPGSGKKTSQFITALANWVKLKRITSGLDKDVLGAAFAIAKKMKKEGMPTRGSYRFSKNGRRTGWLKYTTKIYSGAIALRVDNSTEEYLNNLLTGIIDNFIDEYGKIEIAI